ncbi:MAG: CsbD family protein [Acidimicrobiales bacterium]
MVATNRQLKAKRDQVVGKAKQLVGQHNGDPATTVKGIAGRLKGTAEGTLAKAEKGSARAERAVHNARARKG